MVNKQEEVCDDDDDDSVKSASEVWSVNGLRESGGSSLAPFSLQTSGWRVNISLRPSSWPQRLALPLLFLITANTSSLLLPSCWNDRLTLRAPSYTHSSESQLWRWQAVRGCFFRSLLIAEVWDKMAPGALRLSGSSPYSFHLMLLGAAVYLFGV